MITFLLLKNTLLRKLKKKVAGTGKNTKQDFKIVFSLSYLLKISIFTSFIK